MPRNVRCAHPILLLSIAYLSKSEPNDSLRSSGDVGIIVLRATPVRVPSIRRVRWLLSTQTQIGRVEQLWLYEAELESVAGFHEDVRRRRDDLVSVLVDHPRRRDGDSEDFPVGGEAAAPGVDFVAPVLAIRIGTVGMTDDLHASCTGDRHAAAVHGPTIGERARTGGARCRLALPMEPDVNEVGFTGRVVDECVEAEHLEVVALSTFKNFEADRRCLYRLSVGTELFNSVSTTSSMHSCRLVTDSSSLLRSLSVSRPRCP